VFSKRDLMKDIEIYRTGLFSPLEGFNCREDYERILYNSASQTVFRDLPIVLDTDN